MLYRARMIGLALVSALCVVGAPAVASVVETDPRALPLEANLSSRVVVDGLEAPWSLAFLPDGRLLIAEQFGRIRVAAGDGRLEAAPALILPDVFAGGQAGLMDMVLHPEFASNGLIYFTYSVGTEASNATVLARGRWTGQRVEAVEILFRATPDKPGRQHFGSRIAWDGPDRLYLAIGDGGNPPNAVNGMLAREHAQRLDSHLGKILCLDRNGRACPGGWQGGRAPALPELHSIGHRNIQGLARDPLTGIVWASEHGSQGGDELNRVLPGGNAGWPRATHAREYGPAAAEISPTRSLPGMDDPLVLWTPAIAPSGLAVVRGAIWPADWQGDVLAGGLRVDGRPNPGTLIRVDIDAAGRVAGQSRIDLGIGPVRVRDVRIGPDGAIWLVVTSTDSFRTPDARNGRVVRIGRQ